MITESTFPLKVGIIFLEGRPNGTSQRETALNFDQVACSYLLLELNNIQKIFEFNIVNAGLLNKSLPTKDELRKYVIKEDDTLKFLNGSI